VEDALSGVTYRDDAQIVDERLRKHFGEPARVVITLTPMHEAAR
jgi:Holliday junction resolvase RusA-like endonuclease